MKKAPCLIRTHFVLAMITGLIAVIAQGASAQQADAISSRPYFEKYNVASDDAVQYLARTPAFNMYLKRDEAVIIAKPADDQSLPERIQMKLLDTDGARSLSGEGVLPGRSHYYIGAASAWRTNIRHYSAVTLDEVYDGIDLVYYANNEQLEYDFIVAPGARAEQIHLGFDGSRQRPGVNAKGDLIVSLRNGFFIHSAPYSYQEINGRHVEVPSAYRILPDGSVSIELAEYDHHYPLVIDPAINYAAYLGGSGDDYGYGITTDAQGNFYVTGQTQSVDFPAELGNVATPSGHDAFVSKFSASGELLFTMYLGTADDTFLSSYEMGRAIALDSSGNIYVTGAIVTTTVTKFTATPGAYHACDNGTFDVFVAKIANDGSAIDYFTCLGGALGEMAEAIAVDDSGIVYLAGWTSSDVFPLRDALQGTYGGGTRDAFVAMLSPAGTGDNDLLFSTYLGGAELDEARALGLDGEGHIIVGGVSFSANLDQAVNVMGGSHDGILAKINPAASTGKLLLLRYLGGNDDVNETGIVDAVEGLAVDSQNDIYAAGVWDGQDAFVSRLSAVTMGPQYTALIGGSSSTHANAIAVDGNKTVWVAGTTRAADLPGQNGDTEYSGLDDGFITRLDAQGGILYSLFLGGSDDDRLNDIAVDAVGNVYAVGDTLSVDYPVYGAMAPHDQKAGGTDVNTDVLLARVGPYADLVLEITDDGPAIEGRTLTYSIRVDNIGPDLATNVQLTGQLPPGVEFLGGQAACISSAGTVDCSMADIAAGDHVLFNVAVDVIDNSNLFFQATVSAGTYDFNAANDSVSLLTQQGADVSLQVIDGTAGAGEGLTSGGGALWLLDIALLSAWRLRRPFRAVA